MTIGSIKAVVFDFDGVLVESVDVKTKAFAELYRPYGEDIVARVVAYHLAHGGVSRYEKFRHFHRVFLGRELDVADELLLGEKFSALVEDAVVRSPWVRGASDVLEALFPRFPLFVASGTPDEELLRIVGRRGMAKFFRRVCGAPAKKADILRSIAAEVCCPPRQLLMVGDALTDYDGAMDAGTQFLGRVPTGAVSPFPPSIPVIRDLAEFPRVT